MYFSYLHVTCITLFIPPDAAATAPVAGIYFLPATGNILNKAEVCVEAGLLQLLLLLQQLQWTQPQPATIGSNLDLDQ